ncbi:DUF3891 family protein [Thalassorhabdus alkalitolerans]|uniref:DUF3891 family protein n=1 Tax=Thalassorhabdus alkalitolerans TaxID=2282697 RepID=A0ABW0YSX7_9BACI
MIIREWSDSFELIEQHEHARLSGAVCAFWGDPAVKTSLWEAVILAVKEHDRAWIPLDKQPLWNEAKQRPFSFTDYPMNEKINAYANGVDEIERINPYAALLGSLHYASFFTSNETKMGKEFYEQEQKRQDKLRGRGARTGFETEHLNILQFCDDISLYSCLNQPGVSKEKEYPWFKNGFRQRFDYLGKKKMHAGWRSTQDIEITPFPLAQRLSFTLRSWRVSKQDCKKTGLAAAWKKREQIKTFITFHPPS